MTPRARGDARCRAPGNAGTAGHQRVDQCHVFAASQWRKPTRAQIGFAGHPQVGPVHMGMPIRILVGGFKMAAQGMAMHPMR